MNGKVCLVTGATNGIGKETVLALAGLGATVILVGRNAARCSATVEEIKQKTGSTTIEAMTADLSLMADVRRLAEQVKAKYQRLHVLLNNAGAIFMGRQVTSEGYEMTFALNHLNYFLLTNLLLETLKASAPARIVNVSSDAHKGEHLDFADLQSEKGYFGFTAYGRSKLANVVFTYELSRRLAGTNVTANVLHPGFVRSGFGHNNNPLVKIGIGIAQLVAISPVRGAQTPIYLASSPEVEGVTGKYWEKNQAVPSSKQSYDESTWTRLWDISEQITQLKPAALSR